MPWGNVDRDKYMTRSEAVTYLGIPFERIKPLIDKGELQALQRGKVWYVNRASAKALKERGIW